MNDYWSFLASDAPMPLLPYLYFHAYPVPSSWNAFPPSPLQLVNAVPNGVEVASPSGSFPQVYPPLELSKSHHLLLQYSPRVFPMKHSHSVIWSSFLMPVPPNKI